MKTSGASIHRFRDYAAISATEGPTFYLTANAAKAMGEHLLKLAADIETVTFSKSQITPVDINGEGFVGKPSSSQKP